MTEDNNIILTQADKSLGFLINKLRKFPILRLNETDAGKYAFYLSDSFPYLIGSRIMKKPLQGRYVTYDKKWGLRPILVLPEKEALELIKELQNHRVKRLDLIEQAKHQANLNLIETINRVEISQSTTRTY